VTTAAYGGDLSALRNEILDEFVVTSRRGVVYRCIALMVPGVDVSAQFLYEKFHGGYPATWYVPMRVCCKACAVTNTRRCMDWINSRSAEWDRWKTRMICVVTSPPPPGNLKCR
jgi:hypothetical protein